MNKKKHPVKTSEYFDLPEQLFYLWKYFEIKEQTPYGRSANAKSDSSKLDLLNVKPKMLSIFSDSRYIFISTLDSNSGVFFRHLNFLLQPLKALFNLVIFVNKHLIQIDKHLINFQ